MLFLSASFSLSRRTRAVAGVTLWYLLFSVFPKSAKYVVQSQDRNRSSNCLKEYCQLD